MREIVPHVGQTLAVGTALMAAGGAFWWFSDRAPYPYAQRRLLDLPLPFLTSACLDEVLGPKPGERMLEIGPGTGLQSLHVAPQLEPGGRLDILDIQQEMLDHVEGRAVQQGITTIVPARADARELPYADGLFDAVYLVTALGEIPQQSDVLTEAARVLAPGGRIVVGEFFDRHWIPFGRLHRIADGCGLHLDRQKGTTLAYMARFRRCQHAGLALGGRASLGWRRSA